MPTVRKNCVDELMAEVLNYGGFAMTRADVYRDCIEQGFSPRKTDYIAFARKTAKPEEIENLIPNGLEFFRKERENDRKKKDMLAGDSGWVD